MSNDAVVAVLKLHVLSSTPDCSQKPNKEMPIQKQRVFVAGAGISPFNQPGPSRSVFIYNPAFFCIHVSCSPGYVALGAKAAEEALSSAGLELRHMDAVVCRYT